MASSTTSSSRAAEDQRPQMLAPIISCMVLATLAVVARFFSRKLKKGPYAMHDYFIVAGLVGSLVQSAVVLQSMTLGIGKHIDFVPSENIRQFFIAEYVAKIDYAVTFTLIKISILLLYRSIFPGKRFFIATCAIMAFVIAWGIATSLVAVFSCNPIHNFWDYYWPVNCVDSMQFFIWTTLLNVLGDLLILGLPVYPVWRLQMSMRQRIAVLGMFLLGSFVVVASIIRLMFMRSMDVADATWSYATPAVWFTVELNVAVISACLPTLRPLAVALNAYLVRKVFSRHDSELQQSKVHSAEHKWSLPTDDDTTQREDAVTAPPCVAAYSSSSINKAWVEVEQMSKPQTQSECAFTLSSPQISETGSLDFDFERWVSA